jgi:hypothetical protein
MNYLDTTPPTIEWGVPDPTSPLKILPFPDDLTLHPDTYNRIYVRAKIRDAGSGIISAAISITGGNGGNGSGGATFSASPMCVIGTSKDCRRMVAGDTIQITAHVQAYDKAGNMVESAIELKVVKP